MSAAEDDKAVADQLVEDAKFNAYMGRCFAPTAPVAPAGHPRSPARAAGPADFHQGPRAPVEDDDAAFQRYMAENF